MILVRILLLADADGDGMKDEEEVDLGFDPTDPSSYEQDFGFLEIQVFPADYTFGDEPIARAHLEEPRQGNFEINSVRAIQT